MSNYELRKWRKLLIILLALGVFTLLALLWFDYDQKQMYEQMQISQPIINNARPLQSETSKETEATEAKVSNTRSETELIPVYVSGAVSKPMLCYLPPDSLWQDAVLAAGGLREDAASLYINLAAPISKFQMIYIPTLAEWESGQISPAVYPQLPQSDLSTDSNDRGKNNEIKKISINYADASGLSEIPGVGEKTAALIINYRESQGPFEKIEDLMEIPGIKEAKFAQMKDYITVD